MASLASLKAQLAKVEAAIDAVSDTGQSYSVTGSHSVTSAAISSLEARAQTLRRRIFRFQGYESRTTPDFNDSSSDINVNA